MENSDSNDNKSKIREEEKEDLFGCCGIDSYHFINSFLNSIYAWEIFRLRISKIVT
jgi:hypothetical protein